MSRGHTSLGRAAVGYVAAELGTRMVWFGLVLALGCLLPQRDFGAWSLLMALVGVLEITLTIGLHGPAVRWLYDSDERAHRRILFTLLVLWLPASGLLGLAVDRLGILGFHHIVDGISWLTHGRLALGVAWTGAACALPLAVLAARRRPGSWAGLRIAAVAGPVLGVLAMLATGQRTSEAVLSGQLLGAVLPAVAALAVGFASSTPSLARSELRPMLVFGLPVLPHMLAQWVLSWSDRWLLERLVNLEAVAIYHLAYLPGLGVLLLGGALNRAWYPLFYRDLEILDRVEDSPGGPPFSHASSPAQAPKTREGRATWERLCGQSQAVVAAMATIGATTTLWAGELIGLLPTTGYDASPGLVAFTAAGTTGGLLYLLPHNLLYHHRRTGSIPWMTGVAAALNILLNLALIPLLGPLGAALATVVAYGALAGLFWWMAHRVSRPVVPTAVMLRSIAPALGVIAVAMVLAGAAPSWPLRVAVELICTAAMVGWLLRTGAVDKLRELIGAR